jgi:hypothetical protein
MTVPFSSAAGLRRFLLVAFVLSLGCLPGGTAAAAKLVALSIGVANYNPPLNKLTSPVSDANAVAEQLQGFGFQVFRLLDPDVATFQRGIVEFLAQAKDADGVVLFYSGHGAQMNGENYFLPLDGNLNSEEAIRRDFMTVNSVVEKLDASGARFKFVILDACRSNPFVSDGQMLAAAAVATSGLAEMRRLGDNTLVSFASAPGQVSLDLGQKIGFSLYTLAFVDVLKEAKRIEARDVTLKARDLTIEIGKQAKLDQLQIPWETSSMRKPYWFERAGGGEIAEVQPEVPADKPKAGFILPDSSRRRIGQRDIAEMSPAQLRIARNEIFARHGRIFASADLRQYFSQFAWYEPTSNDTALSEVETANVEFLRAAEQTGVRPEIGVARPAQDFVFPDSERRALTARDLAGLAPAQLRIARNEIYARRGRFFQSADLTGRFRRFDWYKPYTWNPGLNPIERANVALIAQAERRR